MSTAIYYLAHTDDNSVFCVEAFDDDDNRFTEENVAGAADRFTEVIYFTVETGPETLTPAKAIEKLRVLFAERGLIEDDYVNFAMDVGEILDEVIKS